MISNYIFGNKEILFQPADVVWLAAVAGSVAAQSGRLAGRRENGIV